MKHLVIIGAGELGRELYWHAQEAFGYNVEFDIKGFIDDDYDTQASKYQSLRKPLLSSIDDYTIEPDDVFICAIGSVNGREATVNKIKSKGGQFTSIRHKTSIIQGNVEIGEGLFMGPFTIIGDGARIGNHVMINTHSAVGHDVDIGDYTCIMSYVDVTGCSTIGRKVFLASGCRMTPSTKIGDGAYIGIGSVILRKVKPGVKVFGNPAKAVDI